MDMMSPLRGVRVVDFCWVLAGPFGTRILANFGAEVIKIGSRVRGDVHGGVGPGGEEGTSISPLFNDANTGKLSLTLDLRTEEGRALVRRLVGVSDIVTNNYRAGALDRMGLGYNVLREYNPGVILLNLPGCGRTGPWANVRTMGNLIMAASGLSSLTGFPGRPPSGMGVAYPDFVSPDLLATTVLAALRERRRTGRGQELDLSQLSSAISLMGVEWMQFARSGQPPARRQNRDPNFAPHGVYPALGDDEWCAIAVEGDGGWSSLCDVMGMPELIHDPRFATHEARKANEDDLDEIVAAWTRDRDRWEIADLLQERRIAAAAVESVQDTLLVDPHMMDHYQHVQQPSDPDVDIVIDGEAIRFDGVDRQLRRAPMLGEHNDYALRELLGLSNPEFKGLVDDGVIS